MESARLTRKGTFWGKYELVPALPCCFISSVIDLTHMLARIHKLPKDAMCSADAFPIAQGTVSRHSCMLACVVQETNLRSTWCQNPARRPGNHWSHCCKSSSFTDYKTRHATFVNLSNYLVQKKNIQALAPEMHSASKNISWNRRKVWFFFFLYCFFLTISVVDWRELKIKNKSPSWNWTLVLARQLCAYFCAGRSHSHSVLASPPLQRAQPSPSPRLPI